MFAALIEKLQRHQDLSRKRRLRPWKTIMEGHAQPAQIAGFLIGLSMKGERPAEIVGLAQTMRATGDDFVANVSRRCSTRAEPAAIAHIHSTSQQSRHWCLRRAASGSRSMAIVPCRVSAEARICSRHLASRSPQSRRSSSAAWTTRASRFSSRRPFIHRCGMRGRPERTSASGRRSIFSVRSRTPQAPHGSSSVCRARN